MARRPTAVVLQKAPHDRVDKGLACLGNEGVTSDDWQQRVITDPASRRRVAAVLRGKQHDPISLCVLAAREAQIVSQICEMGQMGARFLTIETVTPCLREAEQALDELTEHCRLIPGAFGLEELFRVLYALDDQCRQEHQGKGFLYEARYEEQWRTNNEVEHTPTELGVTVYNLETGFMSTGMDGAPFNLPKAQQESWAKEQGGDGLMSAEEILYLFTRSIMERSLPLWTTGGVRCRNTHGPGGSLSVRWDALDGLYVSHWVDDPHWNLGALARKFC